MIAKPIFVDEVTRVSGAWANTISDLVYDVFGASNTVEDARRALGLGTLALQSANNIAFTGGTLNNVPIGDTTPRRARFTHVSVSQLVPATDYHLTTKSYVLSQIAARITGLGLQDMSRQRANHVNITGGRGIYDELKSRRVPTEGYDVLTLGWYNQQTSHWQSTVPLLVGQDHRTVTLPGPAISGKVVLFVDGIYQLPDQYVLQGSTAVFNAPLPTGSVVGGFQF